MSNFHPDNTRLITGTFMQLDHWDDQEGTRFQNELRSMNVDDWRQTLRDMAEIGIDTLVFQQSVDIRNGMNDIRAYYPGSRWGVPDWMKSKGFLYDEVIDEADELGMTVFHGIYAMHAPDPYLATNEAVELSSIIAKELIARYGDTPSFGGWYWTYEYPPTSISGRDSLKKIVPAIRECADAPFMIAPNIDHGICAAVLNDIDVDIAAYQDSIGLCVEPDIFGRFSRADRFQRLARLPVLYETAKFAHDGWASDEQKNDKLWNCYLRKRGRTALWNDVEIWEFNHNKELLTAELSRIVAQLELTAPYVDKQIIYQYPGLMHHPHHRVKVGGERAATLYEDYAIYRQAVLENRK